MTDPSQKQETEAAVAEMPAEGPLQQAAAGARAPAEAPASARSGRAGPAQPPETKPATEVLGSLLADAAQAMSGRGRVPLRDAAVVTLLLANLLVMAFFAVRLGGSRSGDRTPEPQRPGQAPAGAQQAEPRGSDFEAAIRAGREKRHADAVRLLERHLKDVALPAEELLLVYQQLALQCRLAGLMEESVRYGVFAQSLGHKAWRAEDLLESAGAARSDGRLSDARRILARFLLMEASLPQSARARVPKVELQLAEIYQEDAMRQEGRKQ